MGRANFNPGGDWPGHGRRGGLSRSLSKSTPAAGARSSALAPAVPGLGHCHRGLRRNPSIFPIENVKLHLEGWDVLYNILFCHIANILLHNRNIFGYIAFNSMLYAYVI